MAVALRGSSNLRRVVHPVVKFGSESSSEGNHAF